MSQLSLGLSAVVYNRLRLAQGILSGKALLGSCLLMGEHGLVLLQENSNRNSECFKSFCTALKSH